MSHAIHIVAAAEYEPVCVTYHDEIDWGCLQMRVGHVWPTRQATHTRHSRQPYTDEGRQRLRLLIRHMAETEGRCHMLRYEKAESAPQAGHYACRQLIQQAAVTLATLERPPLLPPGC